MDSITEALERLVDDAADVFSAALTEALPDDSEGEVQLRDLERATLQVMQRIGQRFLCVLIESCQPEEPAERISCRCGGQAEYVRHRIGTVITMMGQVDVSRAYYLCATCHQGTYPLDEQLGFCAGGLSAALQEALAVTGIHLPFELAGDLFERLTGVSISDNGVRDATEQIGQERRERDNAQIEAVWDFDKASLSASPTHVPQRLYGSIDETSVRTHERWRKPKLGCWYTTDERPPDIPPKEWEPRAEAITYYADLTHAEDFGRLLYLTGLQRGADRATELIFVADGAPWIWSIVEEHFPHAVQIVDWFHATEYIWDAAHSLYGEKSDLATAWANERLSELWEGEIDQLLSTLQKRVRPEIDEDPVQEAITYIQNNRHRMRYPEFRAQGYQIGSGTIESGCKRVIGARLKQAGMVWTTDGVSQLIKARAMFFSGEWDDFCQQRQPPRRTYRHAS